MAKMLHEPHQFVYRWKQTEGYQMGRREVSIGDAIRCDSLGSGLQLENTVFALSPRALSFISGNIRRIRRDESEC